MRALKTVGGVSFRAGATWGQRRLRPTIGALVSPRISERRRRPSRTVRLTERSEWVPVLLP